MIFCSELIKLLMLLKIIFDIVEIFTGISLHIRDVSYFSQPKEVKKNDTSGFSLISPTPYIETHWSYF